MLDSPAYLRSVDPLPEELCRLFRISGRRQLTDGEQRTIAAEVSARLPLIRAARTGAESGLPQSLPTDPPRVLSPRQKTRALKMLSAGYTERHTASVLGVSPQTIARLRRAARRGGPRS